MDPSPANTANVQEGDEWGCRLERSFSPSHSGTAQSSAAAINPEHVSTKDTSVFRCHDVLELIPPSLTDNDGFVIPSLGIGFSNSNDINVAEVEAFQPPSPKAKAEDNIYLGPHGAPPSHSKLPTLNTSNHKQRLKQKLKEADRKLTDSGRENKVENIRELVGGGRASPSPSKASSRDWLDPHCQESQFEKWYPQ